jgi:hypothetical protein
MNSEISVKHNQRPLILELQDLESLLEQIQAIILCLENLQELSKKS